VGEKRDARSSCAFESFPRFQSSKSNGSKQAVPTGLSKRKKGSSHILTGSPSVPAVAKEKQHLSPVNFDFLFCTFLPVFFSKPL
jgi:hypothetical protein